MAPTVTRLRHARPGWVAVDLDGARWRTLPAEAVLRAGLGPGVELRRDRAVALARELRRLRSLGLAGKALAQRELTRAELDERLARHKLAPRDREAALAAVARAGLQDDGRAARSRAEALAQRGYGDLAIRADLEQRGVPAELVDEAIAGVAPEAERAGRLIERLGRSARTTRALARRGFGEGVLDSSIAESPDYG